MGVVRAGPDGVPKPQLEEARRRLAAEQVLGLGIVEEPVDARLDRGITRLLTALPVAKLRQETGDVSGVLWCCQPDQRRKYSAIHGAD
jgi:hypothetical protein